MVGEVGAGGRIEQLALGDAVHVASRLLSVAEPDGIVASEATWRLAGPRFVFEPLGHKTLRGVSGSVGAYRVLGTREQSVTAHSPSPLVGRDRVVENLLARFGEVRAGRGRVVIVSGEPGIGKSRLVASLHEKIGGVAAWVEWHCSSYHEGTAFHPVRSSLERLLGLPPGDTGAT